MTKNSYNGWTNYETWLVKLWMDNEEGSSNYWRETAEEHLKVDGDNAAYGLAERLKEQHEETISETVLKPAKQEASFIADLLNAAMSEVNWQEIAESLVNDAKESLVE